MRELRKNLSANAALFVEIIFVSIFNRTYALAYIEVFAAIVLPKKRAEAIKA